VETAAQLQVLRDLQIGAGQGYLLGRPGISVGATFVDVDYLGDEHRVVAASLIPAAVIVPAALVNAASGQAEPTDGDGSRQGRPVAGHDLRTIVLPGARLGGLVGSSPGTA
jgi:EAL domain-containing protein (putative c-di-GMP-specific phosphodiesterase class I)